MGFQGADVQAIEGIDRYRHRTEKDLVSEVVRRGIIPDRSHVDLHALAPAYRPYVLKALLVFNDRFPALPPLTGGITSIAFARDDEACARYSIDDAQIIIDHGYFSKRSALRLQHRGMAALEQAGNALAGAIIHECWHHLQQQRDVSAEAFTHDRIIDATGDPRGPFPLAHQDIKAILIATARPYAAENRFEAEAETVRMHFHGTATRFSTGLIDAATSLYGPDSAHTDAVRERIGFGRPLYAAPIAQPVRTAPHAVGCRFTDTGQRAISTKDFVLYIRTRSGLYRYADRLLVDVHTSH